MVRSSVDGKDIRFADRTRQPRIDKVTLGELVLFYSKARDSQARFKMDHKKQGRYPILGVYSGLNDYRKNTMFVFDPAVLLLPHLELGGQYLPRLFSPTLNTREDRYSVIAGNMNELSIGKTRIIRILQKSDPWLQKYVSMVRSLRKPYVIL